VSWKQIHLESSSDSNAVRLCIARSQSQTLVDLHSRLQLDVAVQNDGVTRLSRRDSVLLNAGMMDDGSIRALRGFGYKLA
jgi:hypothetical protein